MVKRTKKTKFVKTGKMHLVTGEILVGGSPDTTRYIPFRATFYTEHFARIHVSKWNKRGDKLEYAGEVEAGYDV